MVIREFVVVIVVVLFVSVLPLTAASLKHWTVKGDHELRHDRKHQQRLLFPQVRWLGPAV